MNAEEIEQELFARWLLEHVTPRLRAMSDVVGTYADWLTQPVAAAGITPFVYWKQAALAKREDALITRSLSQGAGGSVASSTTPTTPQERAPSGGAAPATPKTTGTVEDLLKPYGLEAERHPQTGQLVALVLTRKLDDDEWRNLNDDLKERALSVKYDPSRRAFVDSKVLYTKRGG